MTRKDYVVVAKVLHDTHAAPEVVYAMADTFAKTYPNFNRNRFVAAALNNT